MATVVLKVSGTRSGLAGYWKGGRVRTEALERKGMHNMCKSRMGG